MKLLTIATALLLSNFANAALIDMGDATGQKSGVDISAVAVANVNAQAYPLAVVGSGTRNKKTIIGTIPVYVVQLLAGDAAAVVKTEDGVLASVAGQASSAIRLTFVRDVPASNVAESFLDALDANGVDTNEADIVKFIEIVNAAGAAANGGSISIVITKNADGTETVTYGNQKGGGELVDSASGAAGFGQKILAIWLGVPADDGLKALKTELLQ